MQTFIKFIYTVFTAFSIFLSSTFIPVDIKPQTENFDFTYLSYPSEAVFSLEEVGISAENLISRADAELEEYVQSGGYDDISGVFVSPYFKAKINEKDIPVYSSMVFNRSENTGDIHSFSEIYVDIAEEFSFNIMLESETVKLKNAIVLPEKFGVKAECKQGVVTASITEPGIYTFLFNGAKQHYGYTLFVREKVDEEEEIREYIDKYGEENVLVVEKGVHKIDYFNMVGKENQVIYLKSGAYVAANHLYDITSIEDEQIYAEEGSATDNAIGLTRYPFLNFYNCKNITLTGRGVIDMTSLDRRERRGVVFTDCENIDISDIKIINAPEWSLISYCCRNVNIENVDILGYRGNCDAFAICNSENVFVNNCFARTADDEFEVKALGGRMGTKNVTFQNCIAWGGYARCFGVTGEVCKSISDITFRDCAVIYRDGIWDNDRIGSLVVVAEQCEGSIDGITFENIEIFRDEGRAILVKVYDEEKDNFEIKNVSFKNITYTSYMQSKIYGNENENNTVEVTLENVSANGKTIKRKGARFIIGKNCDVEFKK